MLKQNYIVSYYIIILSKTHLLQSGDVHIKSKTSSFR